MIQQQMSLALIPHKISDVIIQQRANDGYINATALCKVAGKSWNHYQSNLQTKDFLDELVSDTGIPVSTLVQSLKGGVADQQGTWVHPQVAVHLAQWLSPKFAVLVSRWVTEWLSGGKHAGATMPYHLRRYVANQGAVPHTHFSVLNELILGLIAPLESAGYTLPESLVPDISQGKMFARWLREEKGIDTNAMPTYEHKYEDGRVVQAKMYPAELLYDFRVHFNGTWMPKQAKKYFEPRDPAALPFIDQVLALPQSVPTTAIVKLVEGKMAAEKKPPA